MTSNSPSGSGSKPALDYAQAGVDIDAGNRLVEEIKPLVATTQRPGMLTGIGGFGGLFALPQGYKEPILVSGTDGVGTKLTLALELGIHNTVGIDLVAMCVNDVVVAGAEPLFFLDYYATGKLEVPVAKAVIEGIAKGCQLAGAGLIGGETAELPGMYQAGEYDLAGFTVGVVERSKLLDGSQVRPGDVILGLASSGPHSNGYSLIRKVLEVSGADPKDTLDGNSLGDTLMTPTRIYVKPLLKVLESAGVHALAHITGGGIVENLPRVLPPETQAVLNKNAWDTPVIFNWLQEHGGISDQEMYRTFNCGIGMALVVNPAAASTISDTLNGLGETVYTIGTVESGSGSAGVAWI